MSYLTIARDGEALIEVKRSRFLATLARVESEEAARAVVERLRREHWDARHTCSAFVIGPDSGLQRSSDDGEPAGTAGAPMLEALRGAQVSDVVAVVTRWFGGTLLGTGGLARAYGDAVRAALAETGTLKRELLAELEVALDHADAGRVESELRARGVQILGATYADKVALTVGVRDSSELDAVIAELTGGTVTAHPVGSRWVDNAE